jgi:hypothetical protein
MQHLSEVPKLNKVVFLLGIVAIAMGCMIYLYSSYDPQHMTIQAVTLALVGVLYIFSSRIDNPRFVYMVLILGALAYALPYLLGGVYFWVS